jgi:hypothetical protein
MLKQARNKDNVNFWVAKLMFMEDKILCNILDKCCLL